MNKCQMTTINCTRICLIFICFPFNLLMFAVKLNAGNIFLSFLKESLPTFKIKSEMN